MAHLALALLGPFQARLDGQPVRGLKSDRLRALLAYLAVEYGREHMREEVAALIWPERPNSEALSSLRYALSNIHIALRDRDLSSPFLLITRTTVQFNLDSNHSLDVEEFQHLKDRSEVAALEQAVSLYRGPFLQNVSVADSDAFNEWMQMQTESLELQMLQTLDRLSALAMARGAHKKALAWARRQLELDPYREQAHRQVMAALALSGERSAALTHYESCRHLLAEDLGCEPDAETQALYASIQQPSFSLSSIEPHFSHSISFPDSFEVRPSTRFVAREQELARLDLLLQQARAAQGGVALVSGEVGSGKTSLLNHFARRAGVDYRDLIVLHGRCNAHGGEGDPYMPFREILQTMAGDIEGKQAGGALSHEQAMRIRESSALICSTIVEYGPGLIETFVPRVVLRRLAEEALASCKAANQPRERQRTSQHWRLRVEELLERDAEVIEAIPQPALFEQVTRVLRAVSRHRPLLLVLDDLQWADGGTQALLFHLSLHLAGSRLLVACAFRPEALHAGLNGAESPGVGKVIQELRREWGDILVDLDQADRRRFVEAYIDSEPNRLSPNFRKSLYERTGGNALFVVELLRSFERAGAIQRDEEGRWFEVNGLDWEDWPPQVEAVIAAHLDALPAEDRALLQAASVQGEPFIAEVVARVTGRDEETVIQRLSSLQKTRNRLVEAVSLDRLFPSRNRLSTDPGQSMSRYRFRHWLLQRGAYISLDLVARARLHEKTGRMLEAIYTEARAEVSTLAPELARHYEAAGLPLDAARHRLLAGCWAVRLAAYDEAITHFEFGLALLEKETSSQQRLHLEMGLLVAMSTPLMMQRGAQAPSYLAALTRLSELLQHPELQDDPQRLAALSVLALSAGWSAEPGVIGRVGQQLLDLVPVSGSGQMQEGDRQTLLLGHWALGLSHWVKGQPVSARDHLLRALALDDAQASRPLGGSLVGDPGVMARAMLGAVQWQLGFPDQARACFRQAVEHAELLEQPSSVAFAHYIAAMATSVVGRDLAAARHHAKALQPLGQVSLVYRTWAEALSGYEQACCEEAGSDTGFSISNPHLARILAPDSNWPGSGSGGGYAGLMLIQAEVCARVGQVKIGLEAIDRAQAWIEQTNMRATEAEIWRMRGVLLQMSGAGAEGRICLERSLEIAREQQSRLFELRTALNLARYLQLESCFTEAREVLVGVYGWFTEGLDTPDLLEAKALLDELA